LNIVEMAQAIDMPDTDAFPLRCPNPNCQHRFKEQVGHLKAGKELWCPECRAALHYEVRDFLQALGRSRRGLYDPKANFLTASNVPSKLKH
jgi:hypothetical protein